jgi:hypothetical protein
MQVATPRGLRVGAFVVSFVIAPLLAQPGPGSIKISDATSVRLSLAESLSSATNHEDDPVRFEVVEDVKVGDRVVIAKGATAVGHVVDVEPRKRLGRAGKLNFALDHVKAPDGSNVRLRASSTKKGDDKTGTVIVGSVLLSPLFLIMRGKDVSIPRGTEIMAYVDGDREVALPGADGAPPIAAPGSVPPSAPANKATVSIRSVPDGADVTVDGKYAGSTPSILQLTAGDHIILVEAPDFNSWQRTITVAAGSSITVNAALGKK